VKNYLQLLLIGFVLSFIFPAVNAQQGMLTAEETLLGEASDFSLGIHTGAFDCNQTVKYPYNIGVVGQYNYTPDVSKNWFFGAELGAFYTQGNEKSDNYGRKVKGAFADITVYPGLSFPIGTSFAEEDNATLRLKKLAQARKFRIGLGFTVALPLIKKSEGVGVNLDPVKAGFGFSLRTSYDLPNRLTIFANGTRIGSDLDGLGFVNNTSTERIAGNEKKVSYYYKIGVLWNFVKK
jgi:hypothetical protein